MSLIVHKYGGTSMGSIERITQRRAARRQVACAPATGWWWCPSAMSRRDQPAARAGQGASRRSPTPRELDVIAATGEQVSVGLLALALQAQGLQAVSYAGWQVPMRTDPRVHQARASSRSTTPRVRRRPRGRQGRWSSPASRASTTTATSPRWAAAVRDTSAVAVAAALKADECLIYTDVDGVYTTDPRVVPEARATARPSASRRCSRWRALGTKVLQIRSVEFAGKYSVPTRVLSQLSPPEISTGRKRPSPAR
jgi:aspartate kinase